MQTNEYFRQRAHRLGRGLAGRQVATGMAFLLFLAGCFIAPSTYAVHPLVILEDSYELRLADTRWPESARGTLLLPGCVRCQYDRYRLGAKAAFLVIDQPVSYGEFLSAVRAGRVTSVFVYIDRASGEVSRATVMP